ncbi:MAG: type II toxin-antitoxin system HipA family toxin YjjJ [Planctomycetes bacterium]|nr:type II toxin-antitoxin system HipA family toxin YjjJ [Planctomycetota bacterium]
MLNLNSLIAEIAVRGGAGTKELATALGASSSTVQRLIRASQDRICIMGRGRATRYALSRSIAGLAAELPIRRIDEHGQVETYGTLHLLVNYRHWLEHPSGRGELFQGLPPFVEDMRPQGYMGRTFSALNPELGLPARVNDWTNDQRLIALARRGEDCVGNLILGDESFTRFLAATVQPVDRQEYPELARRSLLSQPGSSAGGEQPKFAVYSGGRHVLVKFAAGEPNSVTARWQDLLLCEFEALQIVQGAGIAASAAELLDTDGARFLQLDRFDRIGPRGRRGVLSLYALAAERLGYLDDWTKAAHDLHAESVIDAQDARRIRWLDAFGQLIGNTDRHFGNLAFFVQDDGRLRLAPVYDMLPMIFAPQDTSIVERPFVPRRPTAENHDVWSDAARQAVDYWYRLAQLEQLSDDLRTRCAEHGRAVQAEIR